GPRPPARPPRQALDGRRSRQRRGAVRRPRAGLPGGCRRRRRTARRRMRLQLTLATVVLVSAAASGSAQADGTLAMRGVYYKERATRVMQPMLDAMFDAGSHGIATGHFLVDAITSASTSSGAANAMPFTERRYEAGLGYAHELGDLTLAGDAKYSTESDYLSRYAGARIQADL